MSLPNKSKRADLVKLSPFRLCEKAGNFIKLAFDSLAL